MADQLRLEMLDDRIKFRPGATIEGIAALELERPVRHLHVHLCWHTEGRGTEDAAVVDTVTFDDPKPIDAQIFRFTAPNGPYSYDGSLIAIQWRIEIEAKGVKTTPHVPLVISPTAEKYRAKA